MNSYFSLSVINSCACLDPADQCENGGTCNDNSPVGSGITCTCPCGFTGKAGSLYRISSIKFKIISVLQYELYNSTFSMS